jgi:hypothetical protein
VGCKVLLYEKLDDPFGSLANRYPSSVRCDSNAVAIKLQIFLRLEVEVIGPEYDFPTADSISRPLWICFAGFLSLRFSRGFIFNPLNFLVKNRTLSIVLATRTLLLS